MDVVARMGGGNGQSGRGGEGDHPNAHPRVLSNCDPSSSHADQGQQENGTGHPKARQVLPVADSMAGPHWIYSTVSAGADPGSGSQKGEEDGREDGHIGRADGGSHG